ncbi:putative lrr receptor-like serine/threonine-protein kinase [Quercus suber]|uniref:Lrr receptor-like serine/threonine-protein kinase n=1 Tax=Quercus suber TaxID=58331 RepID=A0AAW0JAC1_QUESU
MVDAITNIKSAYGVQKNWEGDPCLPQAYSWADLICSYDSVNPPRITSLNLSSSGLTGVISVYISNLTMLQILDLSNNNFTGSVPDFLSQLQYLRVLNLEKNQLTGTIPADLIERSKNGSLLLSVDENLNVCGSGSSKKKNNIAVPIGASVGVLLILALIVASVLWRIKRKQKDESRDKFRHEKKLSSSCFLLKFSNYISLPCVQLLPSILLLASLGENSNLCGSDSCEKKNNIIIPIVGSVGGLFILSLTVAAILWGLRKRKQQDKTKVGILGANPKSFESIQQQFKYSDVLNITNNFTRILGKGGFGKVYHGYIGHTQVAVKMLSPTSMKLLMRVHHRNLTVLVGYCYEETYMGLIYEYMVNGDLETHLSEYKYLKLGSETSNSTGRSTGYSSSYRLTEKSDVYGFGVVLLKIITSRPVIEKFADENIHISQWVSFMLAQGDIINIVDPRLQGAFNMNSAWKAVEIAMLCVSSTSTTRPTMSQVVAELKECLTTEFAQKEGYEGESNYTIEMNNMNLDTELNPVAR